jgi:LysM repeat protein
MAPEAAPVTGPPGMPAVAAVVTVLGPRGLCPFLVSASGGWRMNEPSGDHRCAAFIPATSLAPSKQQRLCLTPAHGGCATYLASTSARAARIGLAGAGDRAGRWAFARTTPVVEDAGGIRASLGSLLGDRRTWPAVPAVLLVTLLTALGISGMRGEGPVTAVSSPSRVPLTFVPVTREPATRQPSALPTETAPDPTDAPATPAPTPIVTPTPAPTATPKPEPSFRTYRVKNNDTLYGIAGTFHTTVSAISRLNHLTSTNLRVGQLLLIPN